MKSDAIRLVADGCTSNRLDGQLGGTRPPKPLFCLTIGIVGHRLDRLPVEGRPRVTAQVNATFAHFAKMARVSWERHGQFYTEESPALRVMSALAEGSDRIGASGGLEHGYSLTAILPFEIEDYMPDFNQQASKEEFERLLRQAETALVLSGRRAQEAAAYETVGLTIVNNSDVLLAIWDGKGPAGWGGTIEFIDHAARNDLPIIHVDARGEQEPRILWSGLAQFRASGAGVFEVPASELTSALPIIVDELVRPPIRLPIGGSRAAVISSLGTFPSKEYFLAVYGKKPAPVSL